ncbi:hypothetical protein ACB092_06G252400 [Castanea dentata]
MAKNTGGDTSTSRLLRAEDGRGDSERGGASGRPREPWKGEFVKSIVYAGLDAIVTCFSLISSISASRYSSVDVLVLGFSNLVADGISMGFGDFVSSSTEKDVAAKERAVTAWDVTNHGGNEQEELLRQYQALGMDISDATTVVNIFAKYKDIFVDEKMMAHKGILPPDEADKPWKNGLRLCFWGWQRPRLQARIMGSLRRLLSSPALLLQQQLTPWGRYSRMWLEYKIE